MSPKDSQKIKSFAQIRRVLIEIMVYGNAHITSNAHIKLAIVQKLIMLCTNKLREFDFLFYQNNAKKR